MKETRGAATVELALLSGINEWSVDQVSELFRKCKLIGAADAIAENQIDGKTLCELSDADLYSAVDDGGLGLKPLQLKQGYSPRLIDLASALAKQSSIATLYSLPNALHSGFAQSDSKHDVCRGNYNAPSIRSRARQKREATQG